MPATRSNLFPTEFLRAVDAVSLRLARTAARGSDSIVSGGRVGTGDEFFGHTPYQSGDDLRQVDWAAFGRLDRLFVKRFRPGEPRRLTVIVDTSPSMDFGEPTKRVFALRLAAAVGIIALRSGVMVRLCRGGERSEHSLGDQFPFLDALARPGDGGDFAKGHREAVHAFCLGGGGLITICDGMESPALVQGMARSGEGSGATVFVGVLARSEISPEIRGESRLTESESGERLSLHVDAPALIEYSQALDRHLGAWAKSCRSRSAEFVPAISDQDPIEVISGSMQGTRLLLGSGRRS